MYIYIYIYIYYTHTDVDKQTWVQCTDCAKWRLAHPRHKHLLKNLTLTCQELGTECEEPEEPWDDNVDWEVHESVSRRDLVSHECAFCNHKTPRLVPKPVSVTTDEQCVQNASAIDVSCIHDGHVRICTVCRNKWKKRNLSSTLCALCEKVSSDMLALNHPQCEEHIFHIDSANIKDECVRVCKQCRQTWKRRRTEKNNYCKKLYEKNARNIPDSLSARE